MKNQPVEFFEAVEFDLRYARVAFGPPMPHPASVFLLVPAGSWLLIAPTAFLARRAIRR